MSYTEFMSFIKTNTSDKLAEYQELCRFCLKNQLRGIDISDDSNYSTKEQRESILNNYTIITKQYVGKRLPFTETNTQNQ